MARSYVEKPDDALNVPSTNDYAPRKYSVREHAVMGLKIFLIGGLLFGSLWVVSLLKAQ